MKFLNSLIELDTKAFDSTGSFKGYASIFGNVDLGGDIVERGAFKEIVRGKNGMVKILNQHNTRDPIGIAEVKQDDVGLSFDGQLILESASARSAYALMKGGALDGMSIGYDVLEGGAKILESGIRQLKALKLWEISPVTFGMNPLAGIDAVKTTPQFETIRECEIWLRDELNFTNSAAKEFVARFKKALVRDEPPRDEVEAQARQEMLENLNNFPKEL
jgi:HK97 family phage prohead protease